MDKPVRHIDHMMWDMEMPTSLVTVVGMMLLKEPLGKDRLMRITEERLLQFAKFRQKIIVKGGKPMWHDDEHFDIHAHIHHVALPNQGSYEDLQEMVSDLMASPLDYSKPLWQVHLIDNYNGGSAIVWRIHHAIADGIALIRVVFSLTGTTAAESLKPPAPEADDPVEKPKGNLVGRLRERLDHMVHLGEDLYQEAVNLLKEPQTLRDALTDSWNTSKELIRLVTDKARTDSIYKGQLGVVKKAAWSEPVPLDKIKQIGKKTGATVNDVLLAGMAGAVRRHLLRHGESTEETFRVICPVNFRNDKRIHIDNRIGMISLELPVSIEDPMERIQAINRKTSQLKRSLEPAAVYTLLNIAGDYLPKPLEVKAAEYVGKRIMGVLSNVPGPREAIYFAGKEVDNIMFWIPQTTALGVGMSIISYNGKVTLGVATDAQVIDDPDYIMAGFHEEFNLMCARILEGCSDSG